MRTLIKLLVLAAVALGAYLYLVPGASVSDLTKFLPLPAKVDPVTGKPLIPCPTCGATGEVACTAKGCVDGKVECNGPCIRLTKGRWAKNPKLGYGPDELFIAFPEKDGRTQYYTKAHVGEVVEMRDGNAVNLGRCKICEGTTRMPCKVCNGTSKVTCKTCQGNKEIPDMNAPGGNPTPPPPTGSSSSQPSAPTKVYQLNDGSKVEGKIIIRDEKFIVVRTPEGKSVQIMTKDLLYPP